VREQKKNINRKVGLDSNQRGRKLGMAATTWRKCESNKKKTREGLLIVVSLQTTGAGENQLLQRAKGSCKHHKPCIIYVRVTPLVKKGEGKKLTWTQRERFRVEKKIQTGIGPLYLSRTS